MNDFPINKKTHENNTDASVLSTEGLLLIQLLESAKNATENRANTFTGKPYHVSSIGKTLGGTYEKIRNSAEYTENHLLLQRAIRRFLNRNIFIENRINDPQLAEELIIELTHGGYITNDSVTDAQINKLKDLVASLYGVYNHTLAMNVPTQKAQSWMLDVLSVECEWIFNDPSYLFAYLRFAQAHLLQFATSNSDHSQSASHRDNETQLIYYIAVLKNLIKSDEATMRAVMTTLYEIPHTATDLKHFNELIDSQLKSDRIRQISITTNKRGAPLRILRSMFFDEPKLDTDIIYNRTTLQSRINDNIRQNYQLAQEKLDNGVVKSVIFLIITKVTIGLAIELPLDLWLYGAIIWLPLAINLLAPPLFMVLQRMTLKVPGERNTKAIRDYIKAVLYADEQNSKQLISQRTQKPQTDAIGVSYAIFSLVTFGALIWLLARLGFNPIQGLIFFIFMSTAAFLGFRLSRIMKDLELVRSSTNIVGTIRDFFYIPFVLIGRWLSGNYAKFNVISILLDLVIELPLKTVLRRARTWSQYLDQAQDDII
jgi:hypothetical protein